MAASDIQRVVSIIFAGEDQLSPAARSAQSALADFGGSLTGEQKHYTLKDHLGSNDVITDSAGNLLTNGGQLSFDAWGQRRNPTAWTAIDINQIIANYGVFASVAPPTTRGFTGHEMPWLSIAAPAFAGLVTFLLLRLLTRFLARPFGKPDQQIAEKNRKSPVRWAFTLLFSLIPASLLWFTGATALRNVGSVAEIRRYVEGAEGEPARSAFVAELKASIDRVLPEAWFRNFDPLANEARVTLAKLIALGDSGPAPKAIPVMEEPELRTLILHDPELRALAKQKRYADVLRDPRLDHVMANPDLTKLLEDLGL